jgi:dihydroneopterin aldolase/2-amino-4-hydroxy-6-hydroxymethyldihydropteridine diphosphokinase
VKGIEAYISVGSNIEPEKNIPEALEKLKEYGRVKSISTFYRTLPIGRPEQSAFLNGVWQIDAVQTARELKFHVLRRIEAELGRVRTEDKYAARTIDLDIILYGDVVIDEPGLRIPDPDIRQRPFIAVPLLELGPRLVLPDTGELLSSLDIAKISQGMEPVYGFTGSLRERIIIR